MGHGDRLAQPVAPGGDRLVMSYRNILNGNSIFPNRHAT